MFKTHSFLPWNATTKWIQMMTNYVIVFLHIKSVINQILRMKVIWGTCISNHHWRVSRFFFNFKCKKNQQMKLSSRHASSKIIRYLCAKFKQEIYTCIYHTLTNWFVILKKNLNCWILQIVHAQALHIHNLNSLKYWFLYFLYRNNINYLVYNIFFASLATDSEYPEVTRNTL